MYLLILILIPWNRLFLGPKLENSIIQSHYNVDCVYIFLISPSNYWHSNLRQFRHHRSAVISLNYHILVMSERFSIMPWIYNYYFVLLWFHKLSGSFWSERLQLNSSLDLCKPLFQFQLLDLQKSTALFLRYCFFTISRQRFENSLIHRFSLLVSIFHTLYTYSFVMDSNHLDLTLFVWQR